MGCVGGMRRPAAPRTPCHDLGGGVAPPAIAPRMPGPSAKTPLFPAPRSFQPLPGPARRAVAGMSMFSTKGGLYERARKKFKISDGIKLFSYPFYKQRRLDVQARACHVAVWTSACCGVIDKQRRAPQARGRLGSRPGAA